MAVCPVADVTVYAGQDAQMVRSVNEVYWFKGQSVQTVAAEMEENLPAVQSEQIDAPVAENLPATQSPQTVTEVAPTVALNLPATQLSHTVRARSPTYLPATHAVHVV